jgi:hypothetical protein
MWQPMADSSYSGFRFFAEYSITMQQTSLFMSQGDYLPEPLKMVVRKPEDYGTTFEPLIRLDDTESQALMDTLWASGLRPSFRGSDSSIVEAKDAHLNDLRAILNRVTGDFHEPEGTK